MNQKNAFPYRVGVCAAASLLTLLFSGCPTIRTVRVDYVTPPGAVADIRSIETMELIPQVTLAGSGVAEGDRNTATGVLVQRLSSGFSREGYFRTTDLIWGNAAGAAALGKNLAKKESRHGYSRYTTGTGIRCAKLELNLTIQLDRVESTEEFSCTLIDQPYEIYYTKNSKGRSIPNSRPVLSQTRKENFRRQVPARSVNATGTLRARLTDADGRGVYEKEFPNLQYAFRTGNDVRAQLPGTVEIFTNMIVPAVNKIVEDLSPHRKPETLEVNPDGDERSLLLMESQAFTEAIRRLDEVLSGEEKNVADYENQGISYEVIGEYAAALSCFEEALKLEPGSKYAAAGLERLRKIREEQKSLRDMDAAAVAEKSGTGFRTQMKDELK